MQNPQKTKRLLKNKQQNRKWILESLMVFIFFGLPRQAYGLSRNDKQVDNSILSYRHCEGNARSNP